MRVACVGAENENTIELPKINFLASEKQEQERSLEAFELRNI